MTKRAAARNIVRHWVRLVLMINVPAISRLFVCLLLFTGMLSYTRVYTGARVEAATVDTLSFQARLYSASGNAVSDGAYSIQFNLYNVAVGGSSVWSETQGSVSVKKGYFSVELGSVTPFGAGIDWSQEKWLTMNVNSDGEMDPRLKLTATPYSILSEQANTLSDGSGGSLTSDDFAQLAPGTTQAVSSALAALSINQTGTGLLAQLQGDGSDVFTVAKNGSVTSSGSASFAGGTVSIGSATQSGGLVVFDGNSNTATLQTTSLSSNRTYTLPDVSGEVCLDSGKCGGSGDINQDGNSFGGAVTIGSNDNFTLNLETGGINRLAIDTSGNVDVLNGGLEIAGTSVLTSGRALQNITGLTIVSGGVSITGGVDNNSGGITDAGFVSGVAGLSFASGNLVLSGGNISSAGTVSSSGNINTSTGDLQTAGTTRIDNSGALQNIIGDNANGVSFNANTITSGAVGTARGGTGVDGSAAANGQLLIGNGTGYVLSTLTGGSGVTITNNPGAIAIAAILGESISTSEIEDGAVTTAKIADGQVTNAKLVNDSLTVIAGTGLTGGGLVVLGDTITVDLDDTVVTPGAYGSASSVAAFTVDQQGRLTAAGTTPIAIDASQVTTGSFALGSQTTGDYVQNIGTLTGLFASGNSGEGSTPALSVLYGSTANTAVAGNRTIICPSGNGNLSGGGNTITLGSGGTCNNLTTNAAVSFGTSVTTPLITNSGTLTLRTQATAGADDLIFQTAGTEKMRLLENGNLLFEKGALDATIAVDAPIGSVATYTFSGASGTVLTTANFAAGGGLDAAYVNVNENPAAGDVSGSFQSGFSVNSVQNNSVDLGTDTVGDYIANLGLLTGLSETGNSGEGSTPALSVLYGGAANTAVQGNTQATFTAGTGLTGGNTLTLGDGGSITFGLDDTTVVGGNYGSAAAAPTFTVDAQGRLTAAGTTTLANSALQNSSFAVAYGSANINGDGSVNLGGTLNIDFSDTPTFNSVTTSSLASSGALTIASTAAGYISINSNSGLINLGASTLATTGDLEIDLAKATDTDFTIQNTGAGSANLNIQDGALHVAGTSVLTNGRVLQNLTGLSTTGNVVLNSFGGSGGLLEVDGSGTVSVATAGIDYEVPLTFSNGLTRTGDGVSLGGTLSGLTSIAQAGNDIEFTGTGQVSIGDSSNDYKLYVNAGTGPGLNVTTTGYSVISSSSSLNAYGFFRSFNTSDSASRFELGAYDLSGASQGGRDLVLNSLGGNVGIGADLTPDGLLSVGSSSQFQVNGSGQITASATANTINGLVINSGTLSSVTGISFTSGTLNLNSGGIINAGSLAGVTIIAASGNINTASGAFQTAGTTRISNAGALQNIVGFDQASGVFSVTGTGAITIGGGSNALTINSTNFDVSSTGALTGITTLVAGTSLTAPTVNATSVFQINGVNGATRSCGNNNYLSNIKLSGGIITGNNGCRGIGLSDARLKTNITEIDASIVDKIKNVNFVNFDFDCSKEAFVPAGGNLTCDESRQTGVIAQELAQIFPELVYQEEDGYYRVKYNALNIYTLKATAELTKTIDGQGNVTGRSLSTGGTVRLDETGQLSNITGLRLLGGGASIIGGIDNNRGGITETGEIQDVTTLTAQRIRIHGNNYDNLLELTKDGEGVFTVFQTGALQLKLTSDKAFIVKNQAGEDFFSVNTEGGLVRIGSGENTDGVLLVLDNIALEGDPVGVNGAQYYNSKLNKFRCYQNNVWVDCISSISSEYQVTSKAFDWVEPADGEIPSHQRAWVDLSHVSSYRVTAEVIALGSPGVSCKLQFNSDPENRNWKDLANDSNSSFIPLATTGIHKSSWLDVTPSGRQDIMLRVVCKGGEQNNPTRIGDIRLQVR